MPASIGGCGVTLRNCVGEGFSRHRRIEQQAAGGEPLEFARLEQSDHAILAVVPGLADHLAGAQPADRLGEQRRAGAHDVFGRDALQDGQLRAEPRERLVVVALDRAARRSASGDLGKHLGERHQVRHRAGGRRRDGLAAVGERLDPMQHADSRGLAAHRAAAAMRDGLGRREPRVAFAVAVEVVLALLGEELDGADIALPGLQRPADGEIVEVAVERGGLAPELAGRMRIGIGGEPIAVEQRHAPVHRRVGREPGLDRKNMIGQIAVAFGNRIEAGLRAERREPRRPDMRRHQIGVGTRVERDLQQVARVEPEDRAAVGGDVADARKALGDAVGTREIGRVDEVMDFARAPGLLVDRGNFHFEHEAHVGAAGGRKLPGDALFDVVAQAEQPGLGGNELVLEFRAPGRMGEVAGADDGDALAGCPPGEVLEVEVPAGRARIFRVNVQVGVEAHRIPRADWR